ASDVGAGESGQLADVVHQEEPGLHVVGVLGAVDGHGDGCFHRTYLLEGAVLISGGRDPGVEIRGVVRTAWAALPTGADAPGPVSADDLPLGPSCCSPRR